MATRTALLVIPCLLAAHMMVFAAGGPVLQYTFEAIEADGSIANSAGAEMNGTLRGPVNVVPLPTDAEAAALSLDGASGFIEVDGSENLHIGADGFTILATVRFADSGTVEAQPDTHDMIVFKNNEYLFGRTGRRLYFNLHNGSDWAAAVTGGECRPDEWTHAAVIVERIDEPPQGRVGYRIRLFLNGELVGAREVLNCTATTTDAALTIGRGWGGPWYFHGDLAQVTVYPRAIAGAELSKLLEAEKLAKVVFQRTADPDPRYSRAVARTQEIVAAAVVAAPVGVGLRRLLAAVTQAENHVDTQASLLPYLTTVRRLALAAEPDPVAAFVRAHPEFVFLDSDRIGVAFFSPRPGVSNLCSLFDLISNREVLGQQRAIWGIEYQLAGEQALRRLGSVSRVMNSTVNIGRSGHDAVLEWVHEATEEEPIECVVRSNLRLAGSRLSMDLEIENRSRGVAIREVHFPVVRLSQLEDGIDRLLVPRMSGVVQPDPLGTYFQYEGPYPSGAAHLQFFAYYDDSHGVYVACEDPKAWSKTLLADAADDDCELSARWFAGSPAEGGNDVRISGEAAIELFAGDWFDAAQIYKRFAQTADWWPASRSRRDTPEWCRNLTLWFIGNANTPEAADALIRQRHDLGLPIGLHWYGWNTESFDDDYPHFTAREGFAETVARLEAEGVHVKPYINGRLWETRDRGDEDVEYTSVALPATAKGLDGKPYIEGYNKRSFSPMCPATPLWQQTMVDLCTELAGYGVSAIYLDQVSAARPRPCFDPSHPHVPGAGEAWLAQGYWPMLERIRRELRAEHPNLALCSEDAAEPYMHVLDSCLPWRFLDIGHVPAYQSIYAGRIQLTARHFGDTSYEALFPKAAEQMLYGEQIGWFGVDMLTSNPAFAAFVKKLAHTRRAFLPFFNEGDMLKPGGLGDSTPEVTADWGFYGPRIITTPALLHSAWRIGDSVAILFANTTCDPVTTEFTPRSEAWGLQGDGVEVMELQEGATPVALGWQQGKTREVSVPGYGLTAWLLCDAGPGSVDHLERLAAATELFGMLRRIDDEAGMTPETKRAELDKRDPWLVPDVPVRSASDWIPAMQAARIVRAKVSPDGTFVGWIADKGSLCFGPVDFGEATGTPVAEFEVAAPPSGTTRRLQLMEAVDGQGSLIAEMNLQPTGSYHDYAIVRLQLPETIAGVHNVVIQFRGSGAGIGNVRRWRLVRQP